MYLAKKLMRLRTHKKEWKNKILAINTVQKGIGEPQASLKFASPACHHCSTKGMVSLMLH